MSIHKIGSIHLRLPDRGDQDRGRASRSDDRPSRSGRERTDVAEFSDAGLSRAAELDADGGTVESRLGEIRDRIDDGYYNRPETAYRLAQRLIESGDL